MKGGAGQGSRRGRSRGITEEREGRLRRQKGQEIGDQVGGRRDEQGEQGGETGQEGEVRSEEGETSEEEQGKKDGGHNRRREEEGE